MFFKKSLVYLTSAILIMAPLTACQFKNPLAEKQPATTQPPAAQASVTTQNAVSTTTPVNIELPSQLETIYFNAANIVFDVIKVDWESAQTRLEDIKTNMKELSPLLTAASVPSNLIEGLSGKISSLEKNISDKKVYESKSEANKITSLIPDIQDVYKTTFPTDLNRLSYLNREIHIDVNQSDWSSARENYKNAKKLWDKLAAKFDSSYKEDTDKLSTSLQKLGKSIENRNSKSTIIDSNTLLGDIGTMKIRLNR